MKIASKASLATCLSTAIVALLLGVGGTATVRAENNPMAKMGAMEPLPTLSANPGSPRASESKSLGVLEEKVTDAAKDAAKQLSTIENINLDDLNSARLAIVKLDMMIDIEKHLADLEKARETRTGIKPFSVPPIQRSEVIPPPPAFPPLMNTRQEAQVFIPPAPSLNASVSRISGANGNFTARIQNKDVHIGDHLSDGATVVAINAQQVSIKNKDGSLHQLKVNGIDEIFGRTL